MIGVNGQYLIMFKVNKYTDFIREDQLVIFRFIEDAGNILPIFELVFDTSDKDIIQYLNQGNEIEVAMGTSANNMSNIKLIIFKRDKESYNQSSTRVRITGFYSALKYYYSCNTGIIKGGSVEVIKKIASKNFKVISNIDTSNDVMSWIQPNISDREYILKVWTHSSLKNNDLLLIGITSGGEMVINSLTNSLKSKQATWKFQNIKENNTDIMYQGSPQFSGDVGLNNHLTGYYRSRIIHDIDGDTSNLSTPKIDPILARTKKQDTIDMGERLGSVSVKTENMHSNYHNSYDLNITKLNSLKSLSAKVNVFNTYFPIKVLDTVLLKDSSGNTGGMVSEDSSGFWIVTRVARIVSNRQFLNVITLCRDGINNIQ